MEQDASTDEVIKELKAQIAILCAYESIINGSYERVIRHQQYVRKASRRNRKTRYQ